MPSIFQVRSSANAAQVCRASETMNPSARFAIWSVVTASVDRCVYFPISFLLMHNGQTRGQRPLDEVLGLAKMPELQAFSPVRSGKQELSTERRVTMSCLRSFAKLLVAAGAIALTLAAQPAMADRLKDILDRGVLRVGHLVDLPPFGMTDKDQKPIGF